MVVLDVHLLWVWWACILCHRRLEARSCAPAAPGCVHRHVLSGRAVANSSGEDSAAIDETSVFGPQRNFRASFIGLQHPWHSYGSMSDMEMYQQLLFSSPS